MKRIAVTLLALGLALPAAALAGKTVRAFTGHIYHLDRGHERGHRHGPQCRHHDRGGHHRRGPGCREVTQYARLPDGRRIPLQRTFCRDRYGRAYELPNSTRIIRRDRFGH